MHGQEEPCRSYSINLYHCRIAKIRTTIFIIQNRDIFYLGSTLVISACNAHGFDMVAHQGN